MNTIKIKFEDVCKQITKRIDNPSDAKTEYYVGLEHIEPELLRIQNYGSPDDVVSSKFIFRKGQILFGRRRAYQRKIAIAEVNGICSTDIYVLDHKPELILKEFLPFFMQSELFFNRVLMLSWGSLSPRVKWKLLAKEEFVIPDLPSQKSYIEIISSVDNCINSTLDLSNTISNLKRMLNDQLIYRGTSTEKFKEERFSFQRYSKIPINWDTDKIENLLEFKKGISYSSSEINEKEIGKIFVNLNTFQKFGGFNEDGLKYYTGKMKSDIQIGDILIADTDITREAEVIGYPLKIPPLSHGKKIYHSLDTSKIIQKDDRLLKEYLYYFLSSSFWHNYVLACSSGTTVLHLEMDALPALIIPIPPKKEQQKIITILSEFDKQLSLIKLHEKKLKQLRKSFLNHIIPKQTIKKVNVTVQ